MEPKVLLPFLEEPATSPRILRQLRSILILSSHLRLSLPSSLFPSGRKTKICTYFSSAHACYMPLWSYWFVKAGGIYSYHCPSWIKWGDLKAVYIKRVPVLHSVTETSTLFECVIAREWVVCMTDATNWCWCKVLWLFRVLYYMQTNLDSFQKKSIIAQFIIWI
jgi:hypothetical protein